MLPLLITLCLSCSRPPQSRIALQERRVVVLVNQNSADGKEIGAYFLAQHHLPASSMVNVNTSTADDITYANFKKEILEPLRKQLQTSNGVDYIVITKGIPLRLSDQGRFSVDGQLTVCDLPVEYLDQANAILDEGVPNPYFRNTERFSHAKFGIYLVTRLDGYDLVDAMQLVRNAVTAKREKGPFFFDDKAYHAKGGYADLQDSMNRASELLKAKGLDAQTDHSEDFIAPRERLAGYASWGSNDEKFDLTTYRKLRFKPGALAETFVSTSGRTFGKVTGGQSLISDLIHQGVTGVKGYVSEPYTTALARPDFLFDRYTSGFNLAESFYAASPVIKWKDIVIGDPLCSPYSR